MRRGLYCRRVTPSTSAPVPVHPHIGVELRAADPVDDAIAIRELLLEHGLVVVRGLTLDAAEVVDAARALGRVLRHPPHPAYPDLPEIAPIANDGALGRQTRPYWHTDGLLRADPPCVTVFYAAEVPAEGGDTLFLDARLAYDALDPDDRATLDGLVAVFETGTRAPLVRRHPVTARPAIAANLAATVGIEGITRTSAQGVIRELGDHYDRPEWVYRHRYEPGDLVLWDNWAAAHSATEPPPPPARRLMLRADVHAWTSYD